MEGDDAGIDQGMEAGHAQVDHGVEEDGMEDGDGDDGALQVQGMEAGDDAELEEAMEDEDAMGDEDEDAALQQHMEGELGEGMEAGDDAGLEEAMEDAGVDQAMDDDDAAGVEEDMEDAAAAGVEQAMGDDAAAAAAAIDVDQFIQEMGGGVALLPQNHVLPLSTPEYEASPDRLRLQWNEFRRSGPLENIVLLGDRDEEEDGYGDGPPETVGPLFRDGDYRSIDSILPEWTMEFIREAFNARTQANIEVQLLNGRRVQLDFLRKICVEIDEEGIPLRTLAMYWVDDQYRVFVSARIFFMDEQVVRQIFTEECRGKLVITVVKRCFHRLHAMIPFCERMQVQRPVFGWYGAEAELVEYGAFEDEAIHTNWQRVEIPGFGRAHGHGVHIAPMRRMMKSVLVSLAGATNQPGHMLLCALALGFTEIVPEGSEQESPSNPLLQSWVGLNALGDTTWHIIWETSDPGGVLPLYLVSFVRAGL